MSSKDLKPKTRLGRAHPQRVKAVTWTVASLFCAGGIWAAWHYAGAPTVEVAVARVRRGDFVISVRSRGEIRSSRSIILKAPQVPGLRIVRLAENGRTIKEGEVVIAFDPVLQEEAVLDRTTALQAANQNIVQAKANQKMQDQSDAMNEMSSEYALEGAKLNASKAAVLSDIEGEKDRIQVGVSEGAFQLVKAGINAHQVADQADLNRLGQAKNKATRDLKKAESYLGKMEIRAPIDGIVNILPNFRSQGAFGQSTPPFKEGDSVWTGAEIVEMPDLTQLYVEIDLEEVDRGKLRLGQKVRVRVDAVPDREFIGAVDWISPIASLIYKGGSTPEKVFPARATLQQRDPRLRPGMSSTAEVIIERTPNRILIPVRASFDKGGKPAVWVRKGSGFVVRPIKIGPHNEDDLVVTSGLREGEIVALENPVEAARRARKKF